MPNGVICGGAVDGSNHAGEIVTCQAITTRPSGLYEAAAAAAGRYRPNAAANKTASGTAPRREYIAVVMPPSELFCRRMKGGDGAVKDAGTVESAPALCQPWPAAKRGSAMSDRDTS